MTVEPFVKNMWPDISPPTGACSSCILSFISECPVFHITGTPFDFTISSGSACEHFTSNMIGCPGPVRSSTSRAYRMST